MNIELITLNENEDGSADCELRMDAAGKHFLLELGFNTMLKTAIEEVKEDEFFMKATPVAEELETPLSFDKESQIHEKAYIEGWNDGFELGNRTFSDEA